MSWLDNNTLTYTLNTEFYDKFFEKINEIYSPTLRYNVWAEIMLQEVKYLEHSIIEHVEDYIIGLK